MHPHDQHFLVIRAVEDADPAALGQVAGGAPEKIMRQLAGAGMLEAENLAALRIDARHHMADDAVLARRVHRLEDQQKRMLVRGIKQLLLLHPAARCGRAACPDNRLWIRRTA